MAGAISCGGLNTEAGISFFTATASAVLSLGTVTLHAFILLSIIRDWKKKLDYFFYKLLLNISLADFLCGLALDPYATIFHIQEGTHSVHLEIKVIHVMLFLLGSVPLASLIFLCVDRVLTLLRPLSYRKGLQGWRSWIAVLSTWVISMIQIMAYFDLGYIAYLVIFASVNIAGASIAMITTSVIYRKNLNSTAKNSSSQRASTNVGQDAERKRKQSKERERTATKTFIIMSVVTVLSYLPTCLSTGYMNACRRCNCTIIHSLRDVAFVSILAGPLFRGINLLVCLKPLRPKLPFLKRSATSSSVSENQEKPASDASMQWKKNVSFQQPLLWTESKMLHSSFFIQIDRQTSMISHFLNFRTFLVSPAVFQFHSDFVAFNLPDKKKIWK